jgi:hypothetical protein
MKFRIHIILGLLALLVVAGCASTKITSRDELVTGQLPRPNTVWVYDFAATAADIPPESALAGQYSEDSPPPSAEQIATDRKVGAEIATQLVQQINAMGMSAEVAGPETRPEINDIVIHGYLLSVVQGSEEKRVIIGFRSGESELKVAAEGFEVTPYGLRKLGSGATNATGAKTPGTAVGVLALVATHNPVGLIVSTGMKAYGEETGSSGIEGRAKQTAKEIADVLKQRFEEQGWIQSTPSPY